MKLFTLSRNEDPVLRKLDHFVEKFILIGILTITLLVCCSCGSTKGIYGEHGRPTQLVEHVQKDTIYLSNIQYDSIYIFQDKFTDRSKDTLYIKDKSIEYRYKLLKDTVRVVQRDSIPYEVNITEIKEIKRPLTWFDQLCRISFGICLSGFLITILCIIKGLRSKL